jgi:hypothetical protein
MTSTRLLGFALASFFSSIACSTPGKEDVSSLPDEVADESKADSLRSPARAGTVRVGEAGEGNFTKTRGWVAYEVELTAGTVELDLSGTDADGYDLDTVVYVFGPKAGGTYPREVLALNDDAGPGDYHSHLVIDAPADGLYRVVVSTYDNYFAWPTNVSRGSYRVLVTCPRLGFGACGPAVSDAGGVCWADGDCAGGLHCEGEITCPPGTACLWVREGACIEDYAWLTYAPAQCLSNPWDVAPGDGDGETPGYPIEELQRIDDYFESQGIDLQGVGLVQRVEPAFVCLACSCPRGDRLVVKARPRDVSTLVALGFGQLENGDALQAFPRQCDGNPWLPAANPAEEGKNIATWAAAQGANLTEVGFVYETAAQVRCLSCACARGDIALAFPGAADAAGLLAPHGFGSLYVD